MLRKFLQAKLHRVTVTAADLNYEGSCGIDEDLLDAVGIVEFQHVEIYNVQNGERFTTYVIKAPRSTGEVSLNGAAARRAAIGDLLIVCAYAMYSEEESARHHPRIALIGAGNVVTKTISTASDRRPAAV